MSNIGNLTPMDKYILSDGSDRSISDKQALRRRNIFPMENKLRHDSWEADVKLRLSDGSIGQARLLSDGHLKLHIINMNCDNCYLYAHP